MRFLERAVHNWAQDARDATKRRDEAIRAWHAQGASVRRIAAAAGISKSTVQRIVEREEEP